MATKNAKGKASPVGATFGNATEVVRAVYDFAQDGGLTTDKYTLLEMEADVAIHSAYLKVDTAFTSGGAATVALGIEGGTEVEVLAATAVAGLTAGTLHKKADSLPLKVASAGKIVLVVGTAALTAGKGELVVEYSKF